MGMCVNPPDVCIVAEYIQRGSLFGILHLPRNQISFESEHIRRFALDTCMFGSTTQRVRAICGESHDRKVLSTICWFILKIHVLDDVGQCSESISLYQLSLLTA